MQSFRSEIENPVVEKDILELERKIRLFKEGQIVDINNEENLLKTCEEYKRLHNLANI